LKTGNSSKRIGVLKEIVRRTFVYLIMGGIFRERFVAGIY